MAAVTKGRGRTHQPSFAQLREYCERRLADPNIHPVDRAVLERKLAALAHRCRRCGRVCQPELMVDGLGSECAHKKEVSHGSAR